MRIKPLASNMTELVLNDGTKVLFSYETPVAASTPAMAYKTAKKWSNTTTRHINKWFMSVGAIQEMPQEYFDNLVQWV
jgi:hypothetical protein